MRTQLKSDGRHLLERFRELAPAREPVAIQRWSLRRVVLTLGVLFCALLTLVLLVSNWAVFA